MRRGWKLNAWIVGSWIPLLTLGCRSDGPTPPVLEARSEAQVPTSTVAPPVRGTVPLLVTVGLTTDAGGIPVVPVAVDPSTLLYYSRTGLPVLAPDGHHVTAGEFSAVNGDIQVKCIESGTHVELHLRDLIPHATYRIWILTFEAPGFHIGPPPDFSNLTGEGALGPDDRSRNTFTASASGEGQITRIHPAGALSETLPSPPFANEPVGSCLLTDLFEFHVVGAFQQPGQPAGADVGPPAFFPESAVEQFVFVFRGD
jgi:hypothetical protein